MVNFCIIKMNKFVVIFYNNILNVIKIRLWFVFCVYYLLMYLECVWYILIDIKDRCVN